MQQDNWQEFDRLIGSKLADAEVKAPRRSWRAISARLDSEAAAASAGMAWWKWAGMSLAAAAVAVGVFFSVRGTGSMGNVQMPENLVAEVTEASPASGQELTTIDELVAPKPSEDVAKAAASHRFRTVTRPHDDNEVKEKVAMLLESAGEPECAAEEMPQNAASENKIVGSPVDESAANAAKWAEIGRQDALERRNERVHRSGIYAQGALGGNDAASFITGKVAHMAPSVAPQSSETITESETSTYGIPFSVGAGMRFYLTNRLSLNAGVNYSLLSRTFSGTYQGTTSDVLNNVSYIGIPVNVGYDLLDLMDGSLKFYVLGGGEIEKCVGNKFRVLSSNTTINEGAKGFQYSIDLGLGAEFQLSNHIGLYVDPGVKYYFPCGQPKSIRTEKPLMISFEAGLRFNL